MMRLVLLLVLSLLSFPAVYAQSYQKQLKLLDNYIVEAISEWNPPGLAVAVIKDGEVIFTKGYGVTSTATNQKVNEHTLFVCASTTKAFTAAAIAMLVDDGKLDWNDKVVDHLPDFRLKDPYVTNELTVIDLLTHRTGLDNTDYLWTLMSINSDSAIYKLREVDLDYSLRSSFIYQNLMYLTAGKVVEAASGQSWQNFLQDRIYGPLKMSETVAYFSMAKDNPNRAYGHLDIDGVITPIEQLNADAIGPAGSMWSSITDMAKWINFLNNNGIEGNDTLISEKNFNKLFQPQQMVPANQFYPSMELTKPNWTTYGLGWFQHDYRGNKVDFHTGSLPGMVAIAGLMQKENIGVYVFGNLDHVELRHAIMYATFDLFLDNKINFDWSKQLKALYDERNSDDSEPEQIAKAPSSIAIDSLIGDYSNDILGKVTISKTPDGLSYNLNNTVLGTIKHFHYDTYQIQFERKYYGEGLISFHRKSDGTLGYLEFWGEQFQKIRE